jgi:TM2 domain-containing membrane protein YozV
MKLKILFSAVMMLVFSVFAAYASFPVERASSTNSTTQVAQVEKNQKQFEYTSPAAAAEGKSQIIALILVALIGGLGIHRFYLGYTWQGVVQLLTLGGCGIWSLIDLVRIITGDLQPKDGSYAKTL